MKKVFSSLILILLFAGVAAANDADARQAFSEGLQKEKEGSPYQAAKKFMAAELLADDPTLRMNAIKKAADSYSKAGFKYKEFICLQKLVVCYPTMINYKATVEKQYKLGNEFYRGARDPAFYWMPWIKDEDRTIEIYETVIKNASFAEYAPELRLRLAKAYLEANKVDKAIETFKEVSEYHPQTKFARFADFELAHIYLQKARRGDGDGTYSSKALELFEKLLKKYPDDKEKDWLEKSRNEAQRIASERIYGIAKFYKKRDNEAAAARYCSTILKDYPESAAAVRSERMLASIDQQYIPTLDEYKPKPDIAYKIEKMPEGKIKILVKPEDSNGKWLLPIEDLGINSKENQK